MEATSAEAARFAERIQRRYRSSLVFLVLLATTMASVVGAFVIRFDFSIPWVERNHLIVALIVAIPTKLILYYLLALHRGWWTSFGAVDLRQVVGGATLASIATTLLIVPVASPGFPRSIYALDWMLSVAVLSGIRLALRMYREYPLHRPASTETAKNVLIYGAGWAGTILLREIWANPKLGRRVIGFIDDDSSKRNESILGVKIWGAGKDAANVVELLNKRGTPVGEILIAMPSANGQEMQEAVANCQSAGVTCKMLPGLGQLLHDKALGLQIRDISVEDLLCREQVQLDEQNIETCLAGRVVMITGAGGSIGSELCRQIVGFDPKALILLDRAESDLFRVDLELRANYPQVSIIPEVADICDADRIEDTIRRHRVECIFHAAAYKHVPLMEAHPVEAAANNVLGTWVLAKAASACHVSNFVMISSDKAVNPTSVMGATKRAAELIVSSFPSDGGSTRFVSVRFGNVLGSNGSVIPIFKDQIAAGGPVTVTHPEVRRYFMTVREATQLVLQASTMARGSEVFVLDMGEPVRIVDLARTMIQLAGYVPDEDIAIRFVGLRPGEKLFEELITGGEQILPTHHEKIKIFRGRPPAYADIEMWVARMRLLITTRDGAGVLRHLSALVPEYTVSAGWKQALEDAGVLTAAVAAGAGHNGGGAAQVRAQLQ